MKEKLSGEHRLSINNGNIKIENKCERLSTVIDYILLCGSFETAHVDMMEKVIR